MDRKYKLMKPKIQKNMEKININRVKQEDMKIELFKVVLNKFSLKWDLSEEEKKSELWPKSTIIIGNNSGS